jgi:CRP-like cAMP-binding protein
MFSTVPDNLQFRAGEVIFREGDTGHVMYGIVSGTVELQVDGRMVEMIAAGDIFGEGALVQLDSSRASTAIAQTDCSLAVINEMRFKFLIENTPNFALEVMRSFSNRLRHFKHPEPVTV